MSIYSEASQDPVLKAIYHRLFTRDKAEELGYIYPSVARSMVASLGPRLPTLVRYRINELLTDRYALASGIAPTLIHQTFGETLRDITGQEDYSKIPLQRLPIISSVMYLDQTLDIYFSDFLPGKNRVIFRYLHKVLSKANPRALRCLSLPPPENGRVFLRVNAPSAKEFVSLLYLLKNDELKPVRLTLQRYLVAPSISRVS